MKKTLALLPAVALLLAGCPLSPPERIAYETVVAAKAFTDKTKSQHPECNPATGTAPTAATSTVCIDIAKAVSAKDALIDAAEVYCAGPDFNAVGACNPPAKGTPASTQALAKLNAAVAAYNKIAAELKGVL
jgi:hypothetical protein